ncbi:GTPase ObgE [compost metagenome]
MKSGDSFVVADIPGIIEGASEGIGLGIQFLRHVERTRLLLHVIDASGNEGRNPVEDFYSINKELKQYSEKLSGRKQIIVANKIDVIQDEESIKELEKLAKKEKLELFKISAVTGEGINELLEHVSKVLKTLPKEEIYEDEERVVYTLKEKSDEFIVLKQDGDYLVEGRAIERLLGRINMDDNESMHYFHKMLKNIGVEAKLKEIGIKEGDTVKFLDWEFEWYD